MSLSLISEFNIFAPGLIQTSVVETTEVTYMPIASVEQRELQFLIPADSDTYVDLNIKLCIRCKLTKADGTNFDNTDFTVVTHNFLHSLFTQCTIALNAMTITPATEIYNNRSYFRTILT